MMFDMNGKRLETAIDADTLKSCTSVHGLVRTMERADINDKQALRLIRNAWNRGKEPGQLKMAEQKKFVAFCSSLMEDGYTRPRVYNGFLFIFSSYGLLITMYRLPNYFSRKRVYDGKVRVRDAKRYTRFNQEMCETLDEEELAG